MNDNAPTTPEIPEITAEGPAAAGRGTGPVVFLAAFLGLTVAALAVLHARQQRLLSTVIADLDKITDQALDYAVTLRQLDPTEPEAAVRDIGTAKPAGRPQTGQNGGQGGDASAQS